MIVALVVLAALVLNAEGTTYTVGDGLGWTFPPLMDTYDTWAKQHTFVVGDELGKFFDTHSFIMKFLESVARRTVCNSMNWRSRVNDHDRLELPVSVCEVDAMS